MDYIKEILDCFEKAEPKANGTKSSAAYMKLFVVDEDGENLSKEKTETFQKIVANMLFTTKRARSDTGVAISYLTTRVREPDQSGWLKMVHLFKYIRCTNNITLILSADKNGILK